MMSMKMRFFLWVLSSLLLAGLTPAQITVQSFEGIDASQLGGHALFDVGPNGAVGTKQYLEWVNIYYQGYDKTTFIPVYRAPLPGITPWYGNPNTPDCTGGNGDVVILFDHLASRWIIARHLGMNPYFYCIAVSNTDDLTAPGFVWYAYELALSPLLGQNSQGVTYFPDYAKIATWSDAYYATFDLQDVSNAYQIVGTLVCAFDRTNMLLGGTAETPQCFRYPKVPDGSVFLAHSLLPADIDGTNPPPAGSPEPFISIQNPSGSATTSNSLNLWHFHVDWTTPANSTFTGPTPLTVNTYTPGCYSVLSPANTYCVPEPSTSSTHNYIDSVGDRLMHRFAFRQFLGSSPHQSYLISHTVQVGGASNPVTGIRWYQYKPGSGIIKSGTINSSGYRFMPSIAQDQAGNMAVGYSLSATWTHPSIRFSILNLPHGIKPGEFTIINGTADEQNRQNWGAFTSMTVDPVDDCTFWYVNEYFTVNQTGSNRTWQTRIANFKASSCP